MPQLPPRFLPYCSSIARRITIGHIAKNPRGIAGSVAPVVVLRNFCSECLVDANNSGIVRLSLGVNILEVFFNRSDVAGESRSVFIPMSMRHLLISVSLLGSYSSFYPHFVRLVRSFLDFANHCNSLRFFEANIVLRKFIGLFL
jgi:hypothetical protein